MSDTPEDVGFFLSGGSGNLNPFLSKGGAISSKKISINALNNLWPDISERQARYGYKDHACFYVKNLSSSLTLKNARLFFNEVDKFITLQIGSAPVSGVEPTAPGNPQPTSVEIPPSQWNSTTAALGPTLWIERKTLDTDDFENVNYTSDVGNTVARQKVGLILDNVNADLLNQKVGLTSWILIKTGAPTGNASCKIWDSEGNVKSTLGTVSVSTLPTALTGTPAPITFENTVITTLVEVGDVVGIEYTAGDSSNFISIGGWDWSSQSEFETHNVEGMSEAIFNNGIWMKQMGGKTALIMGASVPNATGCPPEPPDNPPDPPDPNDPTDPPPAPPPPKPDPVDPGTKRKPTSYSNGIILPSLGPGQFKAIWGERIIPPNTKHDGGKEALAYSLVVEVDETTEPPAPGDPGDPGPNPNPNPNPGTPIPPGPPAPDPQPPPTGQVTTQDGIKLPGLPSTAYSYVDFSYTPEENFRSDGSFRLDFGAGSSGARSSCVIGGYLHINASDDTISGKVGGGTHTDDNNKLARCYIIRLEYAGNGADIQKENPHPDNHDTGVESSFNFGTLLNRWIGVIFIKVNVVVGGKDCARCIAYIDEDGMSTGTFIAANQNWVKVLDATDTGDWFEGIWLTPYDMDDSQTTIRCDEIDDFDYDHLFCATIKGGPAS